MGIDADEIDVRIEGENDDTAPRETHSPDRGDAARHNLMAAQVRRAQELRDVTNGLMTAKSEAQAAEFAFEQASESGDYKAQAGAARRLAAAATRETGLENYSRQLESAPITSGDPFEDHLSRFTEPTAQWMREHREWIDDPRKNAKLIGAHHMAVGEGLAQDSSEYFEFVEKTIGLRGNDRGHSSGRGTAVKYNSDPNTHVLDGGKTVVLTKGERERANDGSIVWNFGEHRGKPIGNAEYARRKAAMIAEGRYNKLG
jgi:hypothetical protein